MTQLVLENLLNLIALSHNWIKNLFISQKILETQICSTVNNCTQYFSSFEENTKKTLHLLDFKDETIKEKQERPQTYVIERRKSQQEKL